MEVDRWLEIGAGDAGVVVDPCRENDAGVGRARWRGPGEGTGGSGGLDSLVDACAIPPTGVDIDNGPRDSGPHVRLLGGKERENEVGRVTEHVLHVSHTRENNVWKPILVQVKDEGAKIRRMDGGQRRRHERVGRRGDENARGVGGMEEEHRVLGGRANENVGQPIAVDLSHDKGSWSRVEGHGCDDRGRRG